MGSSWRWGVLGSWLVVGLFAAMHAGETVGRLELRGGADEMTEARLADSILSARFARPVSEFFAVTFQSPTPVTDCPAKMLVVEVSVRMFELIAVLLLA